MTKKSNAKSSAVGDYTDYTVFVEGHSPEDQVQELDRIYRIKRCDHGPDGRDHASIACGK